MAETPKLNRETLSAKHMPYKQERVEIKPKKSVPLVLQLVTSFSSSFTFTGYFCSSHICPNVLRASESRAGTDGVLAAIFYSVRLSRHVGGCVN